MLSFKNAYAARTRGLLSSPLPMRNPSPSGLQSARLRLFVHSRSNVFAAPTRATILSTIPSLPPSSPHGDEEPHGPKESSRITADAAVATHPINPKTPTALN